MSIRMVTLVLNGNSRVNHVESFTAHARAAKLSFEEHRRGLRVQRVGQSDEVRGTLLENYAEKPPVATAVLQTENRGIS